MTVRPGRDAHLLLTNFMIFALALLALGKAGILTIPGKSVLKLDPELLDSGKIVAVPDKSQGAQVFTIKKANEKSSQLQIQTKPKNQVAKQNSDKNSYPVFKDGPLNKPEATQQNQSQGKKDTESNLTNTAIALSKQSTKTLKYQREQSLLVVQQVNESDWTVIYQKLRQQKQLIGQQGQKVQAEKVKSGVEQKSKPINGEMRYEADKGTVNKDRVQQSKADQLKTSQYKPLYDSLKANSTTHIPAKIIEDADKNQTQAESQVNVHQGPQNTTTGQSDQKESQGQSTVKKPSEVKESPKDEGKARDGSKADNNRDEEKSLVGSIDSLVILGIFVLFLGFVVANRCLMQQEKPGQRQLGSPGVEQENLFDQEEDQGQR